MSDLDVQCLTVLQSQKRYQKCLFKRIGTSTCTTACNVFILRMNDNSKRCAKVIYTNSYNEYVNKYKDLDYIGVVPKLLDYFVTSVESDIGVRTALLLINEYIEPRDTCVNTNILISKLVTTLHANRYIHSGISQEENVYLRNRYIQEDVLIDLINNRALFISIRHILYID
jgi:hypothetical protein